MAAPAWVPVDRAAVAFDLCAIAYLIESAPGLRDLHAGWIVPVRLLSLCTPAVFLLWSQAAFSDPFVPRSWRPDSWGLSDSAPGRSRSATSDGRSSPHFPTSYAGPRS